jgi:hypothetical protein
MPGRYFHGLSGASASRAVGVGSGSIRPAWPSPAGSPPAGGTCCSSFASSHTTLQAAQTSSTSGLPVRCRSTSVMGAAQCGQFRPCLFRRPYAARRSFFMKDGAACLRRTEKLTARPPHAAQTSMGPFSVTVRASLDLHAGQASILHPDHCRALRGRCYTSNACPGQRVFPPDPAGKTAPAARDDSHGRSYGLTWPRTNRCLIASNSDSGTNRHARKETFAGSSELATSVSISTW